MSHAKSPEIDLGGKVAIVTGAASGIGRATAKLYAAAGAAVLCCDKAEAVAETAEAIRAAGGRAASMTMDAGAEPDVAAAVAMAVDTFGGLDIFYANAGISNFGGPTDFFDHTPEQWAEVLRINLIGPFLAIKHAVPAMEARGGGAIVATASVAGLRANAGATPYSASKAGVINLVQTAAQELIGRNIRINAICPGLIETGMTRYAYDYARAKGREDRIGQLNPMRRGGEPEEIAGMALFLVSDLASYVNGQAFPVDGGLSSTHPFVPGGRSTSSMRKASAADLDALKAARPAE
ncbi:MAG: SDR family oxidoreductase [Pseudomonadota bacterium]|nr:SDR family oxidoreductase [Pseudomonadota bacterium]MEE3100390.1 SDR family oxidoreductase [Pseudomonadota bacterium]